MPFVFNDSKKELEVADEEITLCDFLKIFVNLYGTSKWSPSTFSSKVSSIENYINPIIGDWKLNEITTKGLSKNYNDLLSVPEVPRSNKKATVRCVQPANIKKMHDIIRCALNQAIRWEYIDTSKRKPVESRIVKDRFQKLCKENDYEFVVFHSLCHLSTGYKLKMTNGDVKSLQGDTGHAEAEMVTDVYSVIIDEDRRFNAQKMDKEFYSTLNEDISNQP